MSTTTRERPILFSSPMIRAILDGRKTQTRRVVKPQPTHRLIEGLGHITRGMDPADDGAVWYDADCVNPGREVRCPFGRVGDTLWVRETWREIEDPAAKRSECSRITVDSLGDTQRWVCDYAADKPTRIMDKIGRPQWKPSIHTPRRLSRITLEITEVRVQRLQEISEDDARAEGVLSYWGELDGRAFDIYENAICRAAKIRYRDATSACSLDHFAVVWDRINGKTYPWDSDPWVWALTFRRA